MCIDIENVTYWGLLMENFNIFLWGKAVLQNYSCFYKTFENPWRYIHFLHLTSSRRVTRLVSHIPPPVFQPSNYQDKLCILHLSCNYPV